MVTTQFSDTQWNQIMEAWRIFDTDGDGLVTVQDLRTLMLSFGYDHSEKASDFYSLLMHNNTPSQKSTLNSDAITGFELLQSNQFVFLLAKSPSQELSAYLDDLPICVEGDRYADTMDSSFAYSSHSNALPPPAPLPSILSRPLRSSFPP
jgi:hypothetical protein